MTIKEQWATDPVYTSNRISGYRKDVRKGDHVRPLPYDAFYGRFQPARKIGSSYWSAIDVPNFSPVYFWNTNGGFSFVPRARNKAWNSFVDDIREGPASLGIALAEWPQSLSMIADRASQLRRGYLDLRRGNFRDFLRTFGIGARRKHRNKVRNAVSESSSLWLEYSFGWKPLTQDIYEGVNAMGKPVPGGPCSGSGFELVSRSYNKPWTISEIDGKGYCKYGAEVFVSNPNLYLAQQLGLANPAQVAWELVPFSFMVDWVFDVGTCLGAMTDLLGCDVKYPYATAYFKGKGLYGTRSASWGPSPWLNEGVLVMVDRVTSHPYPWPNTSFRANIGTSMNRAANAVSLLGQILTK